MDQHILEDPSKSTSVCPLHCHSLDDSLGVQCPKKSSVTSNCKDAGNMWIVKNDVSPSQKYILTSVEYA